MQFPDKKYEGLHIPNLLSLDDEKRLSALINCDVLTYYLYLKESDLKANLVMFFK